MNKREEKAAIIEGLKDPVLKATVLLVGVLRSLPTRRARIRVLQYINDKMDEIAGQDQDAEFMESK